MHPIRAEYIAMGIIKPAAQDRTRPSFMAVAARRHECVVNNPTARAIAILERAMQRPPARAS